MYTRRNLKMLQPRARAAACCGPLAVSAGARVKWVFPRHLSRRLVLSRRCATAPEHPGPLSTLRGRVGAETLRDDPQQLAAAEELQRIHSVLAAYCNARAAHAACEQAWQADIESMAAKRAKGASAAASEAGHDGSGRDNGAALAVEEALTLPPRPAPPPAPQGLYLWGGVGTGKSMLMDAFFDTAAAPNRRRVHFHQFLLEARCAARPHRWEAVAAARYDQADARRPAGARTAARMAAGADSDARPLDACRTGRGRGRGLPGRHLSVGHGVAKNDARPRPTAQVGLALAGELDLLCFDEFQARARALASAAAASPPRGGIHAVSHGRTAAIVWCGCATAHRIPTARRPGLGRRGRADPAAALLGALRPRRRCRRHLEPQT